MSYEDELRAVGERADADLLVKDQKIAGLLQELDDADTLVTGLKAQNAKLAADLKTCQDSKPQPPKPKTVFGSSLKVFPPGYDMVDIARVYLQSGDRPMTWDADLAVLKAVGKANLVVHVSAKDAPDTWFDSFCKSWKATDHELLFTQNHEFGNDGPNNSFPTDAQIKEYKRRWELVLGVAAKYDYVKTTDIQLGFQTPTEWDKLVIPGTDYCGFDRYNNGIQTPKAYVDPVAIFKNVCDYAEKQGKSLVIGETGTGLVGNDTAGRTKWAADARAYLMTRNVAYAEWWSEGKCALDAATAKAWLS